ncbi:MAG: bifunctional alpha,alpha-trehalose-phosphate synthase (UDP-forming)/trehalose-phosphatase [Planctomycetes bacterium]|nr:bifunctional alpha,alpha-trehalose-phosphate synthase (UDP-forming)/trehalose-phosphatase [Planctomycetota bacterium]
MNGRLLIVANRLPVTIHASGGHARVETSAGGLATGLRGPHEHGEGLWFGWPGSLAGLKPNARAEVLAALAERRFVPIELTQEQIDGYYAKFSNGVLWPVCHYMLDRLPLETPDWTVYRAVNERFADAIAAAFRPGDVIWVHDFHLMLLPELLRRRLPTARIGFFLHIPFPSSEVFRTLPWRSELLRGLLGADLVGFHTLAYLRHFAASLLRLLGLEVEVDRVLVDGREVRLTALPMGIDVAHFEGLAADPSLLAEAAQLRAARGAGRMILGIDRLDYTKGIPRRLLAYERLLERRDPAAPPVQLVQVAVTSRGEVGEYRSFKRQVDELVGRINGRFGTPGHTPIRYMNRGLDSRGVAALYRAADVMLVTPLRDGLNLVAKEFVATRTDGDGVLVLSEFAGVAAELGDAVPYNPYDLDGCAAAIERALAMPEGERRHRMAMMREAITRHDVHGWVRTFLEELGGLAPAKAQEPGDHAAAALALATARANGPLCLLLDYDGSLVPFATRPELAVPDLDLLALLQQLTRLPDLEVHVVSGRSRAFLDRHFGVLPIGLHAEHGFAWRLCGEPNWTTAVPTAPEWRDRVEALLERVARHVPGSHVEIKEQSVGWHFRQVDPAFAATIVKELRLHLLELLSNVAATVVEGNRVLEIRPQGVNKGQAVTRALAAGAQPVQALVVGDDRTDEDMFLAAPVGTVTVRVGPGSTAARYRVADPTAVRALLRSLLV